MKKLILLFAVAGVLLFSDSCGVNVLKGEGKKGTVSRSVSTFNAIDVAISSDVKVTVADGAIPRVELVGYENVMKHIKTEVKDGILHITFDLDDTWQIDDEDMEVVVTVPSLSALSLSGSPDAEIYGNLKGAEFKLDVSGASSVEIQNINVDNFNADMSGKAELIVKGGTVKNASYDISGVGSVEAYPLQTEVTSASISGAGGGEVTASKKLEADISGAGSIKYKGTPEVVKHISGVGSVTPEE
jgi:hypothetical protein